MREFNNPQNDMMMKSIESQLIHLFTYSLWTFRFFNITIFLQKLRRIEDCKYTIYNNIIYNINIIYYINFQFNEIKKCKCPKWISYNLNNLPRNNFDFKWKKSLKNLVIWGNFRTFVALLETDISNKKLRLSQRKFFCRPTSKNF